MNIENIGKDNEAENRRNKMVSCIVTTYKRPIEIVKRALDSVVHQTYQDIELIVVNDAPMECALVEEIGKLLERYTVSKQYIVHEKNKGACAARNTGIAHAKGEYLAFLDDDDEWLPEKLETQLASMKSAKVALVYCSHYVINKTGKSRLIEEPLAQEGCHEDAFEQLLKENYVGSTSYPLLRTEAVREVGGFTEGLRASQDHDLWLRLVQKYPITYCKEPLVNLYYSKESISRNMENSLQGYEYLLDKYEWFYKEHKDIWNYRLNYLAYCCMCFGRVGYAVKYWLRGIVVKPISSHNLMLVAKGFQKIGVMIRNRVAER